MPLKKSAARPAPPFPRNLRLMLPEDIARVAVVQYAAFENTAEGRYTTPYHKKYPDDTINSYMACAADQLRMHDYVCIVIEDVACTNESSFTNAVISDDHPASAARLNANSKTTIIVGYAAWKFDQSKMSHRLGQFSELALSIPSSRWPEIPRSEDRDIDNDHCQKHCDAITIAQDTHLTDCAMGLETMAIHPAYHRKGHGRALLSWGMQLAGIDGAKIGVIASADGALMYGALGWQTILEYTFEGDDVSPEGYRGSIMTYTPADDVWQLDARESDSDADLCPLMKAMPGAFVGDD